MATASPPRIAGLLLVPLAWLIMTMLTSAVVVAMYLSALLTPELRSALFNNTHAFTLQWSISLLTSLVVWAYSIWVTWILQTLTSAAPSLHYLAADYRTAGDQDLRVFAGQRCGGDQNFADCAAGRSGAGAVLQTLPAGENHLY